jgi:hypothetical protein
MRAFTEYLTESAKQYMFRVRIAVDVDEDLIEKLKNALDKFDVDSVSEPKRLPITQKTLGFDHLNYPEINVIDVVTNYPCSPIELQAVFNSIGIPGGMVMVTTANQEVLVAPIDSEAGEGKAILDKDLPNQTYPQILADLEQAIAKKNETPYQYAYSAKKTSSGKTSNDFPQGKNSPIGTTKNKLPNPYKMTRN